MKETDAILEAGEDAPLLATTGSRVLRGGAWTAISRSVPQFYVLALSITAARFLGPSGMGRQSYIAFVEISLVGFLSTGMFVALMRYVGETVGRGETDALHGLLEWAWKVEAALALLGGSVMVASALLGATPRWAWIFAAVVCVLATVQTIPTAVLIGLQRLREAPIPGLVTGLFAVVVIAIVLALGGGITGMFAVEAVVAAVNLVWIGRLARRRLREIAPREASQQHTALRRSVARYALASSAGLMLSFVVARRSELFFLDHYSTEAQISFYSISFAAVTALVQFPLAGASAVTPAFATLHGAEDAVRIARGYARALRLLALTSLPLTAFGIALGPALLVAVYGHRFAPSGIVLIVTLAALPATAVGALAQSLVNGIGRIRIQLLANALAAAVDVGLAALLIPHHGALGAGFANAGGQLALAIALLAGARRAVGRVGTELHSLVPAAVASALAGGIGWLCVHSLGDAVGFAVGAPLAALTFVALALLLRILPAEDAAWLDSGVGELLGGGLGRFVRRCSR